MQKQEISRAARDGRLLSRPGKVTAQSELGTISLGLAKGNRDALLYVPGTYSPENPAPFAMMLHGAGANARQGIDLLLEYAESSGIILLAPDSRGPTWDTVHSSYGPDVAYIDRALAYVFDRYSIDKTHLAIGGFSDGASYALSLGILNGGLFSHIIAFAPCFTETDESGAKKPHIFVSHGTEDPILPIGGCSRRIVPILRRDGYNVAYAEFVGPHSAPPHIRKDAVEWFLGSKAHLPQ
jgi:phospholipase/carboxylesterase